MALKGLSVWIGNEKVGLLAKESQGVYAFGYHPGAAETVSLTMPVRVQGWATRELLPIFQMNIPEGALLETIRNAISKIIGDDDLAILQATGGNQVGRNRFALPEEDQPEGKRQVESLNEILTYPNTAELFHELVSRYALRSGVSGVQPKVLIEAEPRGTLAGEGYIVKSWGNEFPQLAANEFFCMTAVKNAGLVVPDFFLSENGGLFVMRRFDRNPNGGFLGFEDMCSLQAFGTKQKYSGTYERIAKSLTNYVSGENLPAARRQFFATLVLSSMMKNGDAHLKNFGLLYPCSSGSVSIAPVYDVVTTTAYIKNDVPALSIEGSKKWWPRKVFVRFATNCLSLPEGETMTIFERCADAVMETRQAIPAYMKESPSFQKIGEKMMAAWESGVESLMPKKAISVPTFDDGSGDGDGPRP